MPRVTRSALASPARSSPRETTKASSTSSKSVSSPALRTRHGAKEGTSASEETEEKVIRRQPKEKGTGDAGTTRRSGRRSAEPVEEVEQKTRGRAGKAAEKKQKDDTKEEPEETTSRSQSRGRGGKQAKKEVEEEKEVETSTRRKRGGKQQKAEEEEEAKKEKVETPSPASRSQARKSGGRGKQKEEAGDEGKAEESTAKESEETPTRRSRTKLPPPDSTSTPSPSTSRSRGRKERQAESKAMEVEEDKPKEEITPRRRSRKSEATESKTPEASPSSRAKRTPTPKESPEVSGRRGRSARKSEPEKKEEDTKDTAGDDKETKEAGELEAPSLKDERAETKSEPAKEGAEPPSIEQEAPSIHLDNVTEPVAKKQSMTEMPDIEPEPMVTEQEEADKTEEQKRQTVPESVAQTKPEEKVTSVKHQDQKVLEKHPEQVSVVDHKKTVVDDKPLVTAPVVEDISAEEEEESQDIPDHQQKSQTEETVDETANGLATDKSKPAATNADQNKGKRKFEADVLEESVSSKRARVNGDEVGLQLGATTNTAADKPESAEAACADVEMSETRAINQIPQAVQEPSQSNTKAVIPFTKIAIPPIPELAPEVLKEYVIVSKTEVPPPDSKEVADALPRIPLRSSAEPASTSSTEEASSKPTSSSVEEMVTSSQAVSTLVADQTGGAVGSSSAEVQQSSSGVSEVSQVSQVSSQALDIGSATSSFVSESSPAEAMEVDTSDTSAHLDTSRSKQSPSDPVSSSGNLSVTNSMDKPHAQVNAIGQTQNTVFPTAGTSYDIFHRTFLPNPSIPLNSTDVSHRFSIVSYNILADCHMRKIPNTYDYTEPQFLDQEYRHKLLIEELKYLDSDIVCMQEVGPDYFKNLLEPAMNSLGYQGGMMKRTLDPFKEGEATFFKINRFSLVDSQGISLTELAFKELDEAGLTEEVKVAAQKYVTKSDVVYISQLRCNFTHKVVTIGNVHIVWDEHKHPDVQCIQIACAIKEVVNRAGSNDASHIICGDFNLSASTPGYQLACDGYLSDASLATLQALEKLEVAGGSKSLVNHVWRAFQHTSSTLKSAYATVQKHEPALTTFTKFYHDAVDYVFHNSSLETLGVLETVNADVVDATGGLPTKSFPSDHVSLKAELSFKD